MLYSISVLTAGSYRVYYCDDPWLIIDQSDEKLLRYNSKYFVIINPDYNNSGGKPVIVEVRDLNGLPEKTLKNNYIPVKNKL